MKAPLLALLAVALAPLAAAQEPTVNESDFDTTPPTGDETYLDDSQDLQGTGADDPSAPAEEEPTLSESDFDTSAPEGDDSYLDDSEDLAGTGAEDADASSGSDGNKRLPGFAAIVTVGALALVAVATRKR